MLFTAPALAAKAKAPLSNPDFTKGGVIPADAKHDWTLGAAETTSLAPPMAETQPGEIPFCERNAGRDYSGHYYANFGYDCGNENHRLYGADGGRLAIYSPKTGSVRTLLEHARGAIRDPQVHYDGTKVLFSYRKGGTHHYNLYEMNLDGTDLRPITQGDWDDVEPTYLPDGGIAFCSTRCKRYATDVRRIDDAVGDLIQLLHDLGIDRNTLVVFTTDHGPSRESS